MADKSYVIRVSSQKGGVGKTTIATNLAVALASSSKVLLIDADTTNPSVGFQLGLDDVNIGYEEVINNKVDIKKATVVHAPSGLSVLPGTIHTNSHQPSPENVSSFMKRIANSGYKFVVIDTAPGISLLGPAECINEALIITNPEMSSTTASIRLANQFDKHQIKHNLLVNRAKNKRYEISMQEINELYGEKAFGPIPDDESVQVSIAQHVPTYISRPKAGFSAAMTEVARMYLAKAGESYRPMAPEGMTTGGGLIGWLKRIIGLR